MPGGAPEAPPGLEEREPKRSRSAGAAPASRTTPTTPATTSTPTAFGPPDAVGSRRRASGGPYQQPPADPERARADG
eukprot:5126468-Alexandrium_andersonii.AAC.1